MGTIRKGRPRAGGAGIRKVADVLAERHRPRNVLERLVRQSSVQETWTEQFRAVAPAAIAPYCEVADIRGGCLTVQVSNASWATRLRLELPNIQPALRSLADFAGVEEIRIRIARS